MTGGSDLPVIALLCAALALADSAPRRAVLAVGTACALKAIAWPAVPVIAAMLAANRDSRAGWRFAATALLTPDAIVKNVALFPLGLTRHRTPAASPLPGHLLATTGPAGRWAALVLLTGAALAFAGWLALRPPRTASQAAIRLAVALAALCTLAPAARWGYYGYPLALLGWLGLSRAGVFCSYSSERTVPTPSASPAAASVAGAVSTAD